MGASRLRVGAITGKTRRRRGCNGGVASAMMGQAKGWYKDALPLLRRGHGGTNFERCTESVEGGERAEEKCVLNKKKYAATYCLSLVGTGEEKKFSPCWSSAGMFVKQRQRV